MKQTNRLPENIYARRRGAILHEIKGEAALFCSSPEVGRERDMDYEYQQDANIFYLTGIAEPQTALLLLGAKNKPRSILFLRDSDPQKERWQGKRLGLKKAKAKFNVDQVFDIATLKAELPKLIAPYPCLHYAPGIDSRLDQFIFGLLQTRVAPRINCPAALVDARLLTAPLRWIKDQTEIKRLRQAAAITSLAFCETALALPSYATERHVAKALEEKFFKYGATRVAFPSIVASGDHATSLHHVPEAVALRKNGLVLIDAGANIDGYCADVTRTFPLSKTFSPAQAEIYDAVYHAHETALKKIRPGVSMNLVHQAVVQDLCRSLAKLKIVKGTASQIERSKSYQRFFMHRCGHWLGLEAHDISPIIADYPQIHGYDLPLSPGNVITVEPGLYFDAHDTTIPQKYRGIGIRLEDDVVVTKNGNEVLTASLPVKREDIESLF